MSAFVDPQFVKALRTAADQRTLQDLQTIYYGLHGLDTTAIYRDSVLRALCKIARYERLPANAVLFCTGEFATCWYVLLSGAVFINGSMFLPGSSFGKRNGGSVRRPSECFVLESSEMIVIDYPDSNNQYAGAHKQQQQQQHPQAQQQTQQSHQIGGTSFGPPHLAGGGAAGAGGHRGHHPAASSMATTSGGGGAQMRGGATRSQGSSGATTPIIESGRSAQYDDINQTTNIAGHQQQQQLLQQQQQQQPQFVRPELYQKCNRGSHSSDTSSAYSGSDTMTSVHSSSLDVDEVDLSGLVESVVDSDEEDLAESMDSLAVRDTVRECLEKDPSDRTEDDIETLLEFTKNLRAFTNMTLAVRRALCSVMVFAVVEKAGTMVMNNGEELDSWSVLINGHVEIEHTSTTGGGVEREELQVGDSFGILPTMVKLYHRGVMRTKCHDCQFVCITQTDYYRIHHQGEENTQKHEVDGQLVMVTELRHGATDGGQRRGHVVIRGTPERLLLQLIEENSMTDPTYVEDFLLTHRTFTESAPAVAQQLLTWFETETTQPHPTTTATPSEIRDRVTRVVLLWVNNHFPDFETDPQMMEFLETFEAGLERKSMHGHLRLLHIACAAKARTRTVTLARSSRDEALQFSIVGGYERGGYGIFIASVDKRSKPEYRGLKRGDQILEVNGHSFEHVTNARAMELLMSTTHLSITVKSNLLAFKEMLAAAADDSTDSPRSRQGRRKAMADIAKLQSSAQCVVGGGNRLSSLDLMSHDQTDCLMNLGGHHGMVAASPSAAKYAGSGPKGSGNGKGGTGEKSSGAGFMTLGPKRRLQKALIKMNLLPKNAVSLLMDGGLIGGGPQDEDTISASSSTGSTHGIAGVPSTSQSNSGSMASNSTSGSASSLYQSHSNPDLTSSAAAAATAVSAATSAPAPAAAYYDDVRHSDYPEHVLKVFRSDQTCKYLLVHKETTAHEVVMLALQEFGCHESSSHFCLCEVSVGEGGMIKQRRLPEQLQNLAERIGLAARYYLKTNGISETLVPDEMAPDLVRDAAVHFLQLNANELAIQLTFQDFAIFRQIESTEYVDDLFTPSSHHHHNNHHHSSASATSSTTPASSATSNSADTDPASASSSGTSSSSVASRYGVPQMLRQFAELVNREMFWVVSEVCSEPNLVRRSKIVKQFVKIARHCKECKNFNSMFAIVSGLGHAAVSRLRLTWEKLPTKYQKLFSDLQELMDPSRNMSKYRQLVLAELVEQHPIIPFYPVVKKDLTFIHLGNDTLVDGLINFEKLRMIAKEVRSLTHMCSSDLLQMLELKGQPPSLAMVALNQMQMSGASSGGGGGGAGGSGTMSGLSNMAYFASGGHHGSGQATVKRRKKSTAAPNPKKMFEEAQMVRRVKAYLNNMRVITDEDHLHRLSLDCEPPSGGGGGGGGGSMSSSSSAPNSVIIRKRHPSPTLSTTSSTSSASEGKKGAIAMAAAAAAAASAAAGSGGPKFGTASPQAVKKMLALSETTKTRPHQPRHPGNLGPPMGGGAPGVGGPQQQHSNVSSTSGVGLSLNIGLAQQQQQQLAMGHMHHHSGLHHLLGHGGPAAALVSPVPSPGAHRRIGSSSSAGSVSVYSGLEYPGGGAGVNGGACGSLGSSGSRAAVHERSHSDTPTPLPSVDLSAESSSVTSLSNLTAPLRKNMASGSVTSSDSGHGSCVQDSTDSSTMALPPMSSHSAMAGLYHVASSIVHNTPSPIMPGNTSSTNNINSSVAAAALLQQRRHSAALHHIVSPSPPPSSLLAGASSTGSCSPVANNNAAAASTSSSSAGGGHGYHHHHQHPTHKQSPSPVPSSLQQQQLPLPASNATNHSPSLNTMSALTSSAVLPLLLSSASSTASSSSSSSSSVLLSAAGASAQQKQQQQQQQNNQQQPPPLPPSSSLLLASRQLHLQQQQQQSAFNGLASMVHHRSTPSPPISHHHHLAHHHHPVTNTRTSAHGLMMAPPPPKSSGGQQQQQPPPRHPPAYSVAAQMARLHRLGRALSHEGAVAAGSVAGASSSPSYVTAGGGNSEHEDDDDDEDDDDAQVSAV